MTTAATQYPLIGSAPVGNFFTPDNIQRHPLGAIITYDDPNWGGGEAIYLAIPTSVAFKVGEVVYWDTGFNAIDIPNTANLGFPVGFALNANASNASQVQYGWFQIGGQGLALSGASVAAAAAIGITAAGKLGANSAGKQILNVRVAAPATTTVVKTNVQVTANSPIIRPTTTDGWFVGMAVTGTGIPASTTVTAIDTARGVTMSANATATGSVSVTGTYNDGTNFWNVLTMNGPNAQGAIT